MATWSIANLFKPTKPIESFTEEEKKQINKTAVGAGILGGIAGAISSIPAVGSAIVAGVATVAKKVVSAFSTKPLQTTAVATGVVIAAKSEAVQKAIINTPQSVNKVTTYAAQTIDEISTIPSETKRTFGEIIAAAASGKELSTQEKQDIVDLLAKYGKVATIGLGTAALFKLYKSTVGTQYYYQTNDSTNTSQDTGKEKTPTPSTPNTVNPAQSTNTPTIVNVYYDNPNTSLPTSSANTKEATSSKKKSVKKRSTKKKVTKKKTVKKKSTKKKKSVKKKSSKKRKK